MQYTRIVEACLIAAATSSVAIALLCRLAERLGLVDSPDQRKHHIGEVPLIGGLAVFAGVLAGAWWLRDGSTFTRVLVGSTGLIALVGALDDRHSLSVRLRVLLQTVAILVVIFGTGVHVRTLGVLMGYPVNLGWAGIPFTVVAVIGLINAFNLMDGIDGLAGSLGLVSVLAMALTIDAAQMGRPMMLMALLAAGLVPFLACNLGLVGRKIFLGDAGSMVLGYLIAWALIRQSQLPHSRLTPVGVLWCVALPVLDTLAVMYRRLRARKSPFKPDRGHIHHILMDAGLSPRAALACLVGLAAAMAVLGELSRRFSHAASLEIFILMMAVYIFSINRAYWQLRSRLHDQFVALSAANDPDPVTSATADVIPLKQYNRGTITD